VGPDPDRALARAGGADVIVCLSQQHELEHRFPLYLDWLRANAGQRALWWPVPDLHAPPLDDARRWVDELVDRLARDEGLIIHCGGGIGRAPTLAVCLLIALGSTAPAAVAHVAAHRPMAGPESGAQSELVARF
jgi:protein-tyrosine phosphatase